MREPLVTVIIPCFNQAEFLAEAVQSIVTQTYQHWECIIVNDGSDDNTSDVAQQLALSDSRIRYIEQENAGPSSARNRGLDAIHGNYVQFLDADDYIYPDKLREQIDVLPDADVLAVSYTDFACISDDLGLAVPINLRDPYLDTSDPLFDLAQRWGTSLCIPIHSFLFDARIFTHAGIRFDGRLTHLEDYDCWVRIMALKPAIIRVDKKLAVYRWHKGSASQDRKQMACGYALALQKHRKIFRNEQKLRPMFDCLYDSLIREYGSCLPCSTRLSHKVKHDVRSVVLRFIPYELRRRLKSILTKPSA